MTTEPAATDNYGREMAVAMLAGLAAQSVHYQATNGWNPAGDPPSADDLDMVSCIDCGVWIEEAVSHLACSDGARGTCGDCHEQYCTDRACRD